MPLDLKLKIKTTTNCKNLVIEDVTGYYDGINNPGGWGELNQSPNIPNESLNLILTAYHFINGEQYVTTIQMSDLVYYISFPFEASIEGFKVSLPADVLSSAIASARLFFDGTEIISEAVSYSSTCNMRKEVDALLTSIDLSCKDCDQSDFDQALLAKSILEGLEND